MQYAFGHLQLVGYSTNSTDPNALMTTITLTQQADGSLLMTRSSGPKLTGTVTESRYATLGPI